MRVSRKARAIQKHAGRTFANLTDARCNARAARKSGEVNLSVVDGKARMRIVRNSLCRFDLWLPSPVSRIVGCRHNVPVPLRRILHRFHWPVPPRRRIERVNDWPFFLRSVAGGQIERVSLVGVRSADLPQFDLSRAWRFRVLLREQSRRKPKCQHQYKTGAHVASIDGRRRHLGYRNKSDVPRCEPTPRYIFLCASPQGKLLTLRTHALSARSQLPQTDFPRN